MEEGIDGIYVEIVKEANMGCSTDIALFTYPSSHTSQKGRGAGRSLAARTLYCLLLKLNWEVGVSVKRLNYLRFVDDVVSGKEIIFF